MHQWQAGLAHGFFSSPQSSFVFLITVDGPSSLTLTYRIIHLCRIQNYTDLQKLSLYLLTPFFHTSRSKSHVCLSHMCVLVCLHSDIVLFFCHFWQPPVGPSSQPMAPPSPGTNSSTNQSSSSSTAGWEQLSKTNLYIRGLPPATTDHDLVKLCQP